jgi:hypothetical protein
VSRVEVFAAVLAALSQRDAVFNIPWLSDADVLAAQSADATMAAEDADALGRADVAAGRHAALPAFA